ncbi:hypothetical protein D7V96_06680 [bacterium D16-59]|nr:hypothetical protein D7V96_06680 [bacterium D16-59]
MKRSEFQRKRKKGINHRVKQIKAEFGKITPCSSGVCARCLWQDALLQAGQLHPGDAVRRLRYRFSLLLGWAGVDAVPGRTKGGRMVTGGRMAVYRSKTRNAGREKG